MALFGDRIKVTCSTSGTGSTLTLGSAVSGFQTLSEGGLSNGDSVRYVIEDGSNFEIGLATYATGSPDTLTGRSDANVSASSSSNNRITLSGSSTLFIAPTAADLQTVHVYSATSDLPSASDNHGMIAHVHGLGRMVFAHGGNWINLANASEITSYTHPNHSGEVTSTGDGATVIADNVVDEANLKVSNSPTDGYVLTARSGNTGGMTWEAASGGSGIALTDLSVTQNTASGSGTLSYDNTSGVFSYTPPASSGGGGASYSDPIRQTEYTGTATDTFNASSTPALPAFTVGNIQVFLNGSKLAANDFTESSDGSQVQLGSACAASDVVTIVEYGAPFASQYSSSIFTVGTSSEYNTSTKVLTTSYTANRVAVYLNGVKLLVGSSNDFTATDGSTINLTNAAPVTGDTIEVVEHGTLADTVTTLTGLSDTPSSLGTAGQILQVNSGATALEFADASSGSGVTTYTDKTAIDAVSSPSEGDLAYDLAADQLYIRTTSAWKRVSIGVDESPVITTEPPTSHDLNSDGSTSTVTMVATDPEGFGITYGIAYPTTNNALPDQLATATSINQGTGVYTFDPSTTEADAGTVKVRLSASDGISTTTRLCTLSLAFSVDITTPNSAPFTQAGTNTASSTFSSATGSSGMGFSSELSTGKKYFEVVNTQGSTSNNLNGYGIVGLCDNTLTSLGHNTTGFQGIGNSNSHVYAGNTDIGFASGTWNQSGDVLMIAYDTSTREVWFGIDGTWYEDPATESSSFLVGTSSTTSFKMAFGSAIGGGSAYNNSYNLITGSQTLNYTVPTGFTAH